MISYHPNQAGSDRPDIYARGFKTVDTNEPERIAQGVKQYVWSPCVFKDGRRVKSHFLFADWIALDFDTPELPLDGAVKSFCDMTAIIGTTRNHQREKHGITCDRFRVLIKLTSRVTDLKTFEHTAKHLLVRYPQADPAPTDGARFFYPCRDIVTITTGLTEDPVVPRPVTSADIARAWNNAERYRRLGVMPYWLKAFLTKGQLCRVGRNQTVYAASIELRKLGATEAEALRQIRAAPFSREDFSDFELMRTVHSGFGGAR